MDEAKTFPAILKTNRSWKEYLIAAVVLIYLGVGLVVLFGIPFVTFNWIDTPFIGAFLEPGLTFSEQESFDVNAWGSEQLGVQFGDRLLAIDGKEVHNSAEMQALLNTHAVGDSVDMIVTAEDGSRRIIETELISLPIIDTLIFLIIPYFAGLVYVVLSLWVLGLRRGDASARAFAVLGTSVGMALASWFDIYTTHQFAILWAVWLAFAGGSAFHLMMVFPKRFMGGNSRFIRWIGYGIALFLVVWNSFNLQQADHSLTFKTGWQSIFIFDGIILTLFVVFIIYHRLSSPSPTIHQQTRIILWTAAIGLFAGALYFLIHSFNLTSLTKLHYSLTAIPALFFIPVLGISVLRYRLANTDIYLSRIISYTLLAVVAGGGYALLVSGAGLIITGFLPINAPLLTGILIFILALLFHPARQWAIDGINTMFFQSELGSQEKAQQFSNALAQVVELSEIIDLLREYINRDLLPTRLHIYIYNQLTDLYESTPDETRRPSTDIRFGGKSGLANLLRNPNQPSYYFDNDDLPLVLYPDRARLKLLGTQLFVALPGQQLAGWVALGPRSTGDNYSTSDLNYLIKLCEQVALAIERAQVMADKDRRVLEMNVLTRVAQGVNVTLNFDDILELIFAQTTQVMPADDFSITLYTEATEAWRHVFLVEDGKRLIEEEGELIPPGQGLERIVLQTRRYISSENYDEECRTNRVLPSKQGVYAWMGVPLNAGAETIGVVSVGSRDPVVLYTEEQHGILQAVADQAAGAIVKARLLEESERRARQLATLNEVAQNLSSTLDVDPLLKQILDSAVELLNCEAGSLLTLDNETDELVFAVVVGEVADELTGNRIPANEGLVGKTINDRAPVVVNNVGRSEDWSENTDKQSGFETRGLLAVPMMVKDRVIGVLEVLNKIDGMPFNKNDQELLMAFTGQAAIAIENARLYTMTDQKLAERVDELSVMQRIDRELNTTLDVPRVMRITLEWALRQSATEAGLIGFVRPDGLEVIAEQGYQRELEQFGEPSLIPLSLPIFMEMQESERITVLADKNLNPETTLLRDAQAQAAIPIRREDEVIGILLLENKQADLFDEEMLGFLSRLSDHAAIAIANAQLYAEVQRANIAKSDFVSFVAHELKTPMTSIKGYSDLLLAGAVGEVNEAQDNFLSTIRSNINRMATLVSDLADVSRIEAGRLHLEFAPTAIASITDEVVRSTMALIEEKDQKLVIDIPEDLPDMWADRNRVVQVMTNLISNAHKYTLEGGEVTIRARVQENKWDEEGAPQVVHLEVIDSGIGIKEEDQKKIFTQYFRTSEGKDTAPGTGLGLNISRNLVEMQGGKIWFESEFGKGTNFQFTVPVAEAELAGNE